MKEEKVCFKKSAVVVVAVVAIVLSVVALANYLNEQKLNTSSEAATGGTCSLSASNIDKTNNNCEMIMPKTDMLANGATHKSAKEYTGRKCDAGTWVIDKATCMPTIRCTYGQRVYYKADSVEVNFDQTDGNYCLLDASGNKFGYQCNNSTWSTFRSTMCSKTAAAKTECSYGGKALSAWSPPYSVDANNCILTGVSAWTGYYCDPATFKSNYNLTKCPKAAAAKTCTYNGSTNQDGNGCMLTAGGAWTGYWCDTTTNKISYNLMKCPKAATRTVCKLNGISLTDLGYTVNSTTKCILDSVGKNVGYTCDPITFITTRDTKTCPLSKALCDPAKYTADNYECTVGALTIPFGECSAADAYGNKYRCGCDVSRPNLGQPVGFVDATCP